MKFSDIIGQESAKKRLKAMIDNGRLPHALVIEGPEGTGKFALARAAVQYLHCQNRGNGERRENRGERRAPRQGGTK